MLSMCCRFRHCRQCLAEPLPAVMEEESPGNLCQNQQCHVPFIFSSPWTEITVVLYSCTMKKPPASDGDEVKSLFWSSLWSPGCCGCIGPKEKGNSGCSGSATIQPPGICVLFILFLFFCSKQCLPFVIMLSFARNVSGNSGAVHLWLKYPGTVMLLSLDPAKCLLKLSVSMHYCKPRLWGCYLGSMRALSCLSLGMRKLLHIPQFSAAVCSVLRGTVLFPLCWL